MNESSPEILPPETSLAEPPQPATVAAPPPPPPATRSPWAVAVTGAVLCAAGYLAFVRIDQWAERAFAQARLASMLVAVIDVGVLLVGLCLAPALSQLLARVAKGQGVAKGS